MTRLSQFRHWTYTTAGILFLNYSGAIAFVTAWVVLLWVLTHPQ